MLLLGIGLLAIPAAASASTPYGSLSNFDVFNDTGEVTHGFEILRGSVRMPRAADDSRPENVSHVAAQSRAGCSSTRRASVGTVEQISPVQSLRRNGAKDLVGPPKPAHRAGFFDSGGPIRFSLRRTYRRADSRLAA